MHKHRNRLACGLAVAVLAPMAAVGQEIHKCVDNGHVSYQSAPCVHADAVLHVKSTAPTASDAEAAASRAQADKDAVSAAQAAANVAAPPVGTGAAATVSPCKSLSAQYGEALENQDLLNRQPLRATPLGAAPSAMNNARGQASEQIHHLEALMRASNCRIARP